MKLFFAFFASASACERLGSGKLEVKLIKCKNLNGEDTLFDESDPKATLVLKGSEQEEESKEVEGKNNPQWNETFYFDVLDETEVEVTLVDVDNLSKDDELGVFTIPFRKDHGKKTYDVTLGGSCEVETLFQEIKNSGKLEVEIIKCETLPDYDFAIWDNSDPIAEIELIGGGQGKKKTNVILDDLNPEWNEKFSFNVKNETELEVVIKDVDGEVDDWIPNEVLGSFIIPFKKETGNKNHKFKNWRGFYSSCEVTTKWKPLKECEKPKQKICPETFSLGNGNALFRAVHMEQVKTHQAQCPVGEIMVDMYEKPYGGEIFVRCQDEKVTGFKYNLVDMDEDEWILPKNDPKVRCEKKSNKSEVASKEQPDEEGLRDGPKSLAAPACYSCWRVALLVTLM